jgi:glycosyltransferase involved in cell wall biosynthesis
MVDKTKEDSKKCRLGIVFIGGFPPSIARLAEYNYEVVKAMAEKLVKHGVQIYVLANKIDMFVNEKFDNPSNVKVMRVWQKDNTLSLLLKLILMRKKSSMIIISYYHGIFGSSALLNFLSIAIILILGKILHYKILIILHTLPELRKEFFTTFHSRFSYIYYLGLRITSLLMFKIAQRIILLVKTYYNVMCTTLPLLCSKMRYIPHGVPNYVCYGIKTPSIDKKVKIAFIGLISFRKNLLALIEALRDIKLSLNSDIELMLIGAPHPYAFRIHDLFLVVKRAIESGISLKYLGYIPTRDLQEYVFKHIDIVVLPYSVPTGTSGMAHIIAPATTPIIMPSFMEFIELYIDGHGLAFFDVRKENIATELSKVIYDVLTNKTKYCELSKRMLTYSRTHDVNLTSLLLLKEVIALYR